MACPAHGTTSGGGQDDFPGRGPTSGGQDGTWGPPKKEGPASLGGQNVLRGGETMRCPRDVVRYSNKIGRNADLFGVHSEEDDCASPLCLSWRKAHSNKREKKMADPNPKPGGWPGHNVALGTHEKEGARGPPHGSSGAGMGGGGEEELLGAVREGEHVRRDRGVGATDRREGGGRLIRSAETEPNEDVTRMNEVRCRHCEEIGSFSEGKPLKN